jgi:hypothetical protein
MAFYWIIVGKGGRRRLGSIEEIVKITSERISCENERSYKLKTTSCFSSCNEYARCSGLNDIWMATVYGNSVDRWINVCNCQDDSVRKVTVAFVVVW